MDYRKEFLGSLSILRKAEKRWSRARLSDDVVLGGLLYWRERARCSLSVLGGLGADW